MGILDDLLDNSEEEYKRGYEDGKDANLLDQFAQNVNPVSIPAYDAGYADGVEDQDDD